VFGVDTIVVGYDGSEAAERALARAADLAEGLSARLVVASVSPSPRVPVMTPVLEPVDPMLAPGGVAGPVPTRGALSELELDRAPEPKELAQRVLEQARRALTRRRVEAEYVAGVGAPAERLLEIADQHDADLIVVGTREHGFVERLLARPVDEALARKAARDVLLVH
jgi:nucleotide-binding universal stress UspA family protein